MKVDMDQDIEIGQRFFQQMMDIFIVPAIEERQASAVLPRPLVLRSAQVIFFPDGRKPEVRINDEVRAIGQVKMREGVSKNAGDPISEHEMQGLEGLSLPAKEFPGCGHATFVKFGESWITAFDFRYNKDMSRQHLDTATQFLAAAEYASQQEHWSSFVDNLFSAVELTAKATLLLMPDKRFREKASHKAIQLRYNRFADLGNVDPEHITAFNKLYGMRDKARYLKQPFKISCDEASTLTLAVKEMIEWGRKITGPESKF
jgi:uncharacterized protein (UPF0332 family)